MAAWTWGNFQLSAWWTYFSQHPAATLSQLLHLHNGGGVSRVTSLRLKYAKGFLLLMLRSDYPLFPCFSSAFTWMILYIAGRKQVWMADKAAGFIKQSDQICLLGRRCGTTAVTNFGVIFIFVCLPLIFNGLKALGEFCIICLWALMFV